MKITNQVRENIIDREMKLKFHDKILEVAKNFNDAVKKELARISPAVPKELEGYIMTVTGFKVSGWVNNWDCTSKTFLRRRTDTHFPNTNTYGSITIKPTADMKKYYTESKKVQKEREDFRKNLRQILFSVTTDKKLLEMVPEFSIYFEDRNKASTMAVIPVSIVKDVRSSLVRKRGI